MLYGVHNTSRSFENSALRHFLCYECIYTSTTKSSLPFKTSFVPLEPNIPEYDKWNSPLNTFFILWLYQLLCSCSTFAGMALWIPYKLRNMHQTHIQICSVIEDDLLFFAQITPSTQAKCPSLHKTCFMCCHPSKAGDFGGKDQSLLVINLFEVNIMYSINFLLVYLIYTSVFGKDKAWVGYHIGVGNTWGSLWRYFQFAATCWSKPCVSFKKEITWCAFSPYSCERKISRSYDL